VGVYIKYFTPPNIQNGTKYKLNNMINYIKNIYHIILNQVIYVEQLIKQFYRIAINKLYKGMRNPTLNKLNRNDLKMFRFKCSRVYIKLLS
jgi:hypothetical protein